ncbi:MAG: hypothetical protein LRY28_00935 [Erysipelotrichaceae bacterium]|nr:hypothetical protein [Erysipelotrichaceae bacterium]
MTKKTCVIPLSPNIKEETFYATLAKANLIKNYCLKHHIEMNVTLYSQEWDEKKKQACIELELNISQKDSTL